MDLLNHSHRRFGHSPFVFKEGEVAKAEVFGGPEVEAEMAKRLKNPEKMSPDDLSQEIQQYFEEKIGPRKFEEFMRKEVQGKVSPEEENRMVKDALSSYETDYSQRIAGFYRKTEKRISDYEDFLEKSDQKAEQERALLKTAVENAQRAKASIPQIETLGPNEKPSKSETEKRFLGEYIPALNRQYMNLDWQERHLPENDFKIYKSLAKEFGKGVEAFVRFQLESVYEKNLDAKALQEELKGLRDKMAELYSANANRDGFLDLKDLQGLEAKASIPVDIARLLTSGKPVEQIATELDAKNYLRKDDWGKAIDLWSDEFVELAKRNGNEQGIIEAAKKHNGIQENISFRKAVGIFRDAMETAKKTGVLEVLKVVKEFNEATNGDQARVLELAFIPQKGAAIRPMVLTERAKLLDQVTIPRNVDDKLVVGFVKMEREGRDRILSNPAQRQALFLGIKNILAREQRARERGTAENAIYAQTNNLPKKTRELSTSPTPENPSGHDEIARFWALIEIAKEAEFAIKNLDKAKDYQGQNLYDSFNATQDDKTTPPTLDLNFRDVNKRYSQRYVSGIARAGFNGRDIGLGLLQVWGGVTAAVNAWPVLTSLLHGDFEKAEKGLHSPYLYLGAATAYGIHKYNQNPALARLPFESAGGRETILEQQSLDSLARKIGDRKQLVAFLSDGDEFAAMISAQKPDAKQGAKKIETVVAKARKRYAPYPILFKNDLKGVAEDKFQTQLKETKNKSRERLRYLFYEQFLTTPRNLRELKDNCDKWLGLNH
jgi:hypothetical protein